MGCDGRGLCVYSVRNMESQLELVQGILAVLRTTAVSDSIVNESDITYSFIPRGIWTLVEANIGTISACLPILRGAPSATHSFVCSPPPADPQLAKKAPPPASTSKGFAHGHSRNSSGADSVTYVKEVDPEGGGPPRWVLQRQRMGEGGEVELVGREVVSGG